MAALSTEITIRLDAGDRDLLERVALALDRADLNERKPAPAPDPKPEPDDEESDEEERFPTSVAGMEEIARYLGINTSADGVVEAVKELGQERRDLLEQIVSLKAQLSGALATLGSSRQDLDVATLELANIRRGALP